MILALKRRLPPHLLAAAALTLIAHAGTFAGPGAHGPNGEHLDAPAPISAARVLPRVEAQTDGFELVAELRAGELVILVDRYASNEPVLGANLEVESGPLKAAAAFRADRGDYVVTDAAMLKALSVPGEHGLVFTLLAGADSDLLNGTLKTGADKGEDRGDDHGHDHGDVHERERAAWIGTGVAVLGLISGMAWWRLRRRDTNKVGEGR